VLLGRREKLEGLLVLLQAVDVDLADGRAVDFARSEARLKTLVGRALGPRALPVVAAVRAPDAPQLAVYIGADTRFLRAGPQLIRRNQPRRRGVQKAHFRLRKIIEALPRIRCFLHGDIPLLSFWQSIPSRGPRAISVRPRQDRRGGGPAARDAN